MDKNFDVVIVGGSYAGLSAALSLSRARRKVLVMDSANPCNLGVSAAHNFIGHENQNPQTLRDAAKKEILAYPHTEFWQCIAEEVLQGTDRFFVRAIDGRKVSARRVLFASGISDLMPGIAGFRECWGKTILHCPYCHGYEQKDQPIAILANGEHAFHLCLLLCSLSPSLSLYTNGPCTLSPEQEQALRLRSIEIQETGIQEIEHHNGQLQSLKFGDGSSRPFRAAFAKVELRQQCSIPEQMGCEFNEHLIKVDDCMRTSIQGVFAAGDNCHIPRTIGLAIASGMKAAFQINWELCQIMES